AVEPAADRRALADGRRLPGQDEEDGLEGVLGVLLRVEQAPAHAPDGAAVPLDQFGQGRLVAVSDVSLQQVLIAAGPGASRCRVLPRGAGVGGCHGSESPGTIYSFLL